MQDLIDFINLNDLIYVDFQGSPFTWPDNRKGHELMQVKFYRLLVSFDWQHIILSTLAALPRMVSKHAFLLFNWSDGFFRNLNSFRYEIVWQSHPNFRQLVEEWWNIRVKGMTMFRLASKVENVRINVVHQGESSFRDIFKKEDIESKLEEIQNDIAKGDLLADTLKE